MDLDLDTATEGLDSVSVRLIDLRPPAAKLNVVLVGHSTRHGHQIMRLPVPKSRPTEAVFVVFEQRGPEIRSAYNKKFENFVSTTGDKL